MSDYRKRINEIRTEHRMAEIAIERERFALDQSEESLESINAAQSILQLVAQQIQQQAHKRIAGVVTKCLEMIFEEESYEFKILFELKRGRTEAKLVFVREGMEVDPLTASGGGVIDVAAFALRLSCLMLTRPPVRRLLILDEPFRFVSADYRSRVKEMLETLAREMNVQFIMVTHSPDLQAGKVVEL